MKHQVVGAQAGNIDVRVSKPDNGSSKSFVKKTRFHLACLQHFLRPVRLAHGGAARVVERLPVVSA